MYYDDFELINYVDIPSVQIIKENMIKFAKKYDNIPLHTDEEYAKSTHFGELIAPGLFSFVSVWSKYLEIDMIGKDLLAGKSLKIEWLKPVYVNDILSGRATLEKKGERSNKNGIIEISIDAYNQDGELVFKNVIEAIVKRKL